MRKKEEPILVAIHCLVYNHEPYLRDCFEGFVKQKTNFRFVAIVHEDCSTDNSAAIIREYEAKYPDIFRPIYESENQWSKHDGSLERIMNNAIDATGAKYVAMCEGDDYWTDPLKLQKQVDILEADPDFSMCYSDFETVDEHNNVIHWQNHESHAKRSFTGYQFRELLNGNYIITATILVRAVVYMHPAIVNNLDYSQVLNASLKGKFYYIKEKLARYRSNPNSLTNTQLDKIAGVSREIWCNFVEYYLNTPAVHRNFVDYVCTISTIDAVLISQLRSKGDVAQHARELLSRHKVLWTTYPFGILLRVQNRLRKMIRKYAQRS